MKSVYRVFAFIIAAEVVIQASAVAYGLFGIGKYIDDGATVTKATVESDSTSFTGLGGLALHGINGMMIIPLLALVFLIISFFAKVPGGVKWASFVFLAVVVQVTLGLAGHSVPALGALHGINALLLFGLAITAGMRVNRVTAPAAAAPAGDAAAV
jgi:hypothetical protein